MSSTIFEAAGSIFNSLDVFEQSFGRFRDSSPQQQTHDQRSGGCSSGGPLRRSQLASLRVFYRNLTSPVSQLIRTNLAEAQKIIAGNGTEEQKAEARVEADVYEALQHAVATK